MDALIWLTATGAMVFALLWMRLDRPSRHPGPSWPLMVAFVLDVFGGLVALGNGRWGVAAGLAILGWTLAFLWVDQGRHERCRPPVTQLDD